MAALYRIFLKGLLALLPLMLTAYLIAWIGARAENALGDGLQALFPSIYFPGLGVALAIGVIFVVGLMVDNYLAKEVLQWIERNIERAPVIKAIYGPIRDIMSLFAEAENKGLKRAVLVSFPQLGVSLVGLVTRENFNDLKGAGLPENHIAVFLPYSYAVGGFTLLVSRDNVRELDMAPDKALQLALTGWLKAHDSGTSAIAIEP